MDLSCTIGREILLISAPCPCIYFSALFSSIVFWEVTVTVLNPQQPYSFATAFCDLTLLPRAYIMTTHQWKSGFSSSRQNQLHAYSCLRHHLTTQNMIYINFHGVGRQLGICHQDEYSSSLYLPNILSFLRA